MKKITKIMTTLCLVLVLMISISACSCGKTNQKISVIIPDGAPALAVAQLLSENNTFNQDLTYTVVKPDTLTNYVPTKADIAVVPINSATKLCGDKYKIVAVNTHGNLFVLGEEEITDMTSLVGKKVACIQYANVPGLTLRTILNGKNIPYTQLGELTDSVDAEKVNIYNCDPTAVASLLAQGKVDYALCAEPSVTIISTNLSAKGIKVCLDIQEEYYKTFNEHFPQAVTIISNDLIKNNKKFVKSFIEAMKKNDSYVTKENISSMLKGIEEHLDEGLAPTFDEKKLTENSLKNCNVKYVDAYSVKEEIINYIEKVKAVDSTKVNSITDEIFYK